MKRDANRLAKLELYPLNGEQEDSDGDDENDIESKEGEPDMLQDLEDNNDSDDDECENE